MFKKTTINLLLAAVIFLLMAGEAFAQTKIVSPSASIKTIKAEKQIDYRVVVLGNYLKKMNSPLAPYANEFIDNADKYNIDWRLVPAITGVESTFGKRIPYKSYNAYGWANGNYYFDSWEDSIDHVSKILRYKYYDRGIQSIDQIAKVYAPPSNDWGWKVKYFMNEIDPVPVGFDL